jgi:rod shape-determining protein MreC
MSSFADRRFGRHLLLYVAIILSFGLLASTQKQKNSVARVCHSTILFPFLRLNETISEWSDLAAENRKLSVLVAQLLLENSSLKEARLENERLRRLLNFVRTTRFQGLPAKIVGGSPQLGLRAVVVNVGESAGVRKNMPVIASDGVVGRVMEALENTAVVLLLTDPNCPVAAIDQRTRVLGIVRWRGHEGMILDNIPLQESVSPGDNVVSSGLGGIFPEGLKLGVVTRVRSEKGEIFKEIKLKPAVNFNRLEEVYILRATEG